MLHQLFWQDVFPSSGLSKTAGVGPPCPETDEIVEVLKLPPYAQQLYAFELNAAGKLNFAVHANGLVVLACASFDACDAWLATEELFEQDQSIPIHAGLRFVALHFQAATKDEYAVVVVNPTGASMEAIVEARYA